MSYEMVGKLHRKFDTENKSSTFQAREFIVETVENPYPQLIKFQLTQDKCDLLNRYNEGEMVKVYFDLRGREWNGKFFTNLNAWKIEANQVRESDESFPEEPFSDDYLGSDESGGSAFEDFNEIPF